MTIRKITEKAVIEHMGWTPADFRVEKPANNQADYAVNVSAMAKKHNRNPLEAAKDAAEKLKNVADVFERVEAAGGYVNFFLKTEYLQKELAQIAGNADYGHNDIGKGKKVIVEYPSVNIAKPMHIGHMRSAIIGDALANVYEKLGWQVIRWNYIGDWGTQFGKLIYAWKKWGDEQALKKDPIAEMLQVYIKFHDEAENNPDLEKEGQKEFRKLEEGDAENTKLWTEFKELSLSEFQKIAQDLGVNVSGESKGEAEYNPRLKPLIQELQEKGIVKESEGALIIELENLPPMLLRKSDGATLYATRDIASLEDRIQNYQADKILYVVANQQALHFEQLFAVAKKLGWSQAELIHVKFGMVLGEDGKKLATREGKTVALEQVMAKIISLALETVKEKNPSLDSEEAAQIAHAVGIGALKYNDLKQHPYSDITFDWRAMLDLSGNSGPYLQYTYSRLFSILKKAEQANFQALDRFDELTAGKLGTSFEFFKFKNLSEKIELELIKKLLDFPEAVEWCARDYALNGLALYLYELANHANRFYETIRILEDANMERRNARLQFIAVIARTLKQGLTILGIQTPERI